MNSICIKYVENKDEYSQSKLKFKTRASIMLLSYKYVYVHLSHAWFARQWLMPLEF